ncbi:MAG TPA: TetR/AcrR family transcriptional regulator [Candidatus Binatia bacterium]|jgi:AcrR family transcriptional regulator
MTRSSATAPARARDSAPGETTRQDRRKLRTRARLIGAARAVVGRKGAADATILDITEEADVGFGTFYNYFDSKDAILAATSAEVVEAHGAALDRLTAPLADDAEVIAICVRHTARTVDTDPLWAWFAVRGGLFEERIEAGLGPRLARDVRRGMERERFPRGNVALLSRTIGAAVASVLRGKLAGELGADADRELSALVLRILGIPPAEADAIAGRPLPARDSLTLKGDVP